MHQRSDNTHGMSAKAIGLRVLQAFGFLLCALSFSGCEAIPIALPNPLTMGKGSAKHIPWKEVPANLKPSVLPAFAVQSHEDLFGTLSFYSENVDGYEIGGFRFKTREGPVVTYPRTWKDTIVDAGEVRWPNGESWAMFVWDCRDHDKHRIRTLSLFDPRERELVSWELGFASASPTPVEVASSAIATPASLPGEILMQNLVHCDIPNPWWAHGKTTTVRCRLSWQLGLPKFKKYREFLHSIKGGYADAGSWMHPTPGLRNARSGACASATFAIDINAPYANEIAKMATRPSQD